MLEMAFQSFQISKFSGGACPLTAPCSYSQLLFSNQVPTSNFIETPGDLTHTYKRGPDKVSHCLQWVNRCFVNSQIYCDEGIADVVLRVDEPLSCSYVITVHTNKLCKHSLFRPNPAQKPHAITCSPALSEERYKIYIERIGKLS